jgi:hypothetical protein
MPVEQADSRIFIDATYRVIEALGSSSPWFGGPVPPKGMVVAETNPSVVLAMMVPQQSPATLPSRSRAFRLDDGRTIRAKSDWYWAIGGSDRVGRVLGIDAASETDHELVAALTCLSLAAQLAGLALDGTSVIAIGDEEGIYVAPGTIDRSWREGVDGIVHYGAAVFEDLTCHIPAYQQVSSVVVRDGEQVPVEVHALDVGEIADLLVCDGGGVWERHNHWLRKLSPPLLLRTISPNHEPLDIRMRHGRAHESNGQWTPEPSAAGIARHFDHDGMLSRSNRFTVPVTILQVGVRPATH